MPLTEKQKKLPKGLQDAIMAKDKKKPMKKQTKKDRLDESEGKARAKRETKIIRKRKTY